MEAEPPTTESKGTKKKGTRAKKAKAAESVNSFGNDQCHVTTINFIQMTFWYLEMCAAIAEGDIGRVFEVLKACLRLVFLHVHTNPCVGFAILILGRRLHQLWQ
jgi:hypothetical protein